MKTEKVGSRINHLLIQQDLSLEQLSERTGLEPHLLQCIVQDDIYPSLGPLLKIARALGVRLGTFLDDQVSKDPLIVRRNERTEHLHMLQGKDAPVALKFYSLGLGKTDRHMEPFYVELLPESASDEKLTGHEGEEFIVVYSGKIEVIYGKEIYHLEAGDSIYYNSVIPHYVSCWGDQTASIYAVLYIPE